MIRFPNAKINLGLRVVEKRPDGYHNLETAFFPIGLCDALELVTPEHPASTAACSLEVVGLNGAIWSESAEENIVSKAYRLLAASYPIAPVTAYLKKGIPTGAGLGGGSSDGAFMVKMLSERNGLGLPNDELMRISAQIGADCAFFIENNPIFAKGIGNEFEPIDLCLNGWFLVLVKPEVHVSTAEAYALVRPARPDRSLKECLRLPLEQWRDTVVNDFEPSVFHKYPEIAAIKDRLYAEGAVYAAMSGSGSSVYGLFAHPVDLRAVFPDCFYWSESL
jgi:4-diphosphocytidyl-2-C-methyl-D-erythritol kinase